jgi:Xaa-Pro aminopeptidase
MNFSINNLSELQSVLKTNNIDAYIISSTDPHLGEYVPDHWRVIAWLTGFTGSNATAVVTCSFAGLWTDSRYFIQAENQLDGSGFTLMKSVFPDKREMLNWLSSEVKEGHRIALDGRTFSILFSRNIEASIRNKNIEIDYTADLISSIWEERPSIPLSKAFDHSVNFCGKERAEKIAEVQLVMKNSGVDYQLLTSPDDIMWLLNIRGDDVKYCPVINSFALVGSEQVLLFVDERQIPFKLAMEFDKLGVVMLPYDETEGMLTTLSGDSVIMLSTSSTSISLFKAIPQGIKIVEGISIPSRLKAIKNNIEIKNIEKAMIKDGIALTRLFFWLENYSEGIPLIESSVALKVDSLRSDQPDWIEPSFSTIAAWNKNGALPHYSPLTGNDSEIAGSGILLIDSGGQYLDGTTDITRTIAIGPPTDEQKNDYTRVLKGMISLASAKFPEGTRGNQLDILARKALWEGGLNYGHGTGHGVGFCLNVHEGPQNIGPGPNSQTVLEPGMLLSDEPGIYREGRYGIRIENLILCVEEGGTEFGKFLGFRTMSLCYIDKELIAPALLDNTEIMWLNSYHSSVYEKISPFLSDQEREFLKIKTAHV